MRSSLQRGFRWSLHRGSLSAVLQMPAGSTTAPLPWSAWTSGDTMSAGAANLQNKKPELKLRRPDNINSKYHKQKSPKYNTSNSGTQPQGS